MSDALETYLEIAAYYNIEVPKDISGNFSPKLSQSLMTQFQEEIIKGILKSKGWNEDASDQWTHLNYEHLAPLNWADVVIFELGE